MNLRARILLAVVVVLATAGVVTSPGNGVPAEPLPGDAPVVVWTVDGQPAHPFDNLPAEAAVRLHVHWTAPLYCYVASWSATDGTLALFPTPWLVTDLKNPMAAGKVTLPGK